MSHVDSNDLLLGFRGVHVWVTTVCDLMCADCCQYIPSRAPGEHFAWSTFEHAARYLRGQEICVIGGEPTTHPGFDRIAREFHTLFATDYVEILTNGYGVVRHAESMAYFDKVKLTNYPRIRTQAALVWLQQHMPERLAVLECGHVPLTTRGPGGPCIRRLAPAYVNGRLHPCCWVPGFADAETIALTDDWQEKIAQVRAPCDRCMFSEAS